MNDGKTSFSIIEYDPQYREDCEQMLVELEEYLISIDQDRLDHMSADYKEKMFAYDLAQVAEQNGKCFLAVTGGCAIGLIMGVQRSYSDADHLDYTCPPAGVITELIVREAHRSTGVGHALLRQMEEWFADVGCAYAFVDVFAYNQRGIRFYECEDYHTRMLSAVKKLSAKEEPEKEQTL